MASGVESVTCADFYLTNSWVEDRSCNDYFSSGHPLFIIDQSTMRKYLNHTDTSIRVKLVTLSTVGTPICHTISIIGHTAYRIAKIVSAAHFWGHKENEEEYSLLGRAWEAFEDIVKVVAAPFVLCALEASAIYGLFRPLDGRKLYASLERFAFYDRFFLAPCFQPNPTRHLLGGDLRNRDAV